MYHIFWQVPQQILCLSLEGELSLEDFNHINLNIIKHLDDKPFEQAVVLVVDVSQPCSLPRDYARLKASQTYATRRDLNFILVVSTDKFIRLVTLLIFNLCRPMLKFFASQHEALGFIQQ